MTGPVRIDLMIEGQEGVTWDTWCALALAAEDAGFGAIHRSDHQLSLNDPRRIGSLDAWTTLAGLAAITARIRLGTNVSPVAFRHPVELARSVATVDHISNGRVELGMGAGWYEDEHTTLGFGFPAASARFDVLEEQLEIVTRLWTAEEPFDFTGKTYVLRQAVLLPRPVQLPRPWILVGGMAGPRSARLAARWADEYNLYEVTPEEVVERRRALASACDSIGRDPASLLVSMIIPIHMGEDDGLASAERLARMQGTGADPAGYLDGIRDRALVGTSDEIVARIHEYVASGVERVRLQHLVHDDVDAVRVMGATIVGAVHDITTRTSRSSDPMEGT